MEQKHNAMGDTKSIVAALPSIGLALLPKLTCAACWPAYTGILTAMGLGFVNYSPYLLPMMVFLLAVTIGVLGYSSVKRRRFGPIWIGLAAAALIVIGKFVLDNAAIVFGGSATMFATTVWNAWPVKRREELVQLRTSKETKHETKS